MSQTPVALEEYERLTAIVSYATIKRAIISSYPHMSARDRDEAIVAVLDRMARLHGWSIRREVMTSDDDQ